MVIAGVASELTVAITQEAVPKVLVTVEVRGPAAMRSTLNIRSQIDLEIEEIMHA